MTKQDREEQWSWYEAKKIARGKKYQRETMAAEEGWDLPEEDFRGRSVALSLRSNQERPASSGRVPSPEPPPYLPPPEPEKKNKKKKKKDDCESSPSDDSDHRKGNKKRRQVVININ